METNTNKPTRAFWIIAIVALVWNALGVMAYLMDVMRSDAALAALPATEQALYENTPAWATGAYAIAVFGGLFGCIGLLMKKKWATALFALSLLGVLVQMFHAFLLSDTLNVYGGTAAVMPVLIVVVAAFLVWYSRGAAAKGWLS